MQGRKVIAAIGIVLASLGSEPRSCGQPANPKPNKSVAVPAPNVQEPVDKHELPDKTYTLGCPAKNALKKCNAIGVETTPPGLNVRVVVDATGIDGKAHLEAAPGVKFPLNVPVHRSPAIFQVRYYPLVPDPITGVIVPNIVNVNLRAWAIDPRITEIRCKVFQNGKRVKAAWQTVKITAINKDFTPCFITFTGS